MKSDNIRIIIIDDHHIVQLGLKKFFDSLEGYQVVAEAGDADSALRLISDLEPHVAIIDISLKGNIDGIELTRAIKSRFSTRVIILSMHDEMIYIDKALKSGADGYITKDEPSELLIEAITQVMKGSIYLTGSISARMINKMYNAARPQGGAGDLSFTERELEILKLIGTGCATSEIAHAMNISAYTVESHRRNLREKLNLKDGAALLKWAIKWVNENNEQNSP